MRKITIVFLIGLLVLVLAAPGFAENERRTFTVDPFTGFYTFDREQKLDARSYYGVRGGYNFTKRIGMEAMFGYVPTETVSMAVADRDVKAYRLGLDGLFYFNPEGQVVPFISAGLGVTQTDTGAKGITEHGRGMVNYGVGVKYFITESVALRGDVKQSLFSEGGDARINMEYTVGLTFVLGAEKKQVARVGDTTAPHVVCTSPDNGYTGVAVDRSINATFNEEMKRSTIDESTFTLKLGTKSVSGTVTSVDTTAYFKPTNDLEPGTTYTATVVAGVKDVSGNAMEKSYTWKFTTVPAPKIAKIVPAVLISLEDSHFAHDSTALSEDGKTILNYNAKILKDNPKMKIRVAGYASASGTQEYNQKLSERRATAVKNYLVKEGGIAENRLTKIGFGEDRPAEYEPVPSDIYSEAAKANQRVLFEIIVK